jgi:hypothetical protein
MYLLNDSMGKVREIILVLASYCYVHEFNQLFGSKVRSYHRYTVAVVVMVGMIFLITPMRVF